MWNFKRHFLTSLIYFVFVGLTGIFNGGFHLIRNALTGQLAPTYEGLDFHRSLMVSIFSLLVAAPVTSVGHYLFTRKQPVKYWERPLGLVLILTLYLIPWTLPLGLKFPVVLCACIAALTLPVIVYWGIFTGLDLLERMATRDLPERPTGHPGTAARAQ